MITINDLTSFTYNPNEYNYQPSLTEKLDKSSDQLFTQDMINEIVLWKINRYVCADEEVLNMLNSEEVKSDTINKEVTKNLLLKLIRTHGVRLALASTVLRFRNPKVYQIIDQRVFRFIYGKELKIGAYQSMDNITSQIEIYLKYLDDLRNISDKTGWDFSQLDRILYALDIKHNKEHTIKY